MKATKLLLSICLFQGLICLSNLHAGFDNGGTFQSNNLNINTTDLNNTGKMIGQNSVNIECDKFTGNGYVKGPLISIKAKEFLYTGTIECSGECLIITQKPFKHTMFKKAGPGIFKFEVQENWQPS
ncbi:MAG: hypothetical protein H0V82_00250 [Candidatus Protochlamydia sp.]|nr:hypothetical protein [Candidatus Protochlamydia sp.]